MSTSEMTLLNVRVKQLELQMSLSSTAIDLMSRMIIALCERLEIDLDSGTKEPNADDFPCLRDLIDEHERQERAEAEASGEPILDGPEAQIHQEIREHLGWLEKKIDALSDKGTVSLPGGEAFPKAWVAEFLSLFGDRLDSND